MDIARFRDPAADRAEFLAELRRAAHEVGFFYVVGHGVPERLTTGIFDAAKEWREALPGLRETTLERQAEALRDVTLGPAVLIALCITWGTRAGG
ncbi:2-oxoglutarate and iron-dependent oxygenase domain-containing protein [Amycolatopsis sp. NBC_00438]